MFKRNIVNTSKEEKVLRIRYANGSECSVPCEIQVNSISCGILTFPPTTAWDAWGYRYTNACIPAGNCEVAIKPVNCSGQIFIDSIELIDDMYTGDWAYAKTILDRIKPPVFSEKQYNITSYGAVGDGTTDNYQAFKQAIEECSSMGGGKVIVPEGTFLINGPIHLKSDVRLNLSSPDTIIRFGTNPDDYLVDSEDKKGCVLTSWEGTRLYNYSPAIYAYNQVNIAITGLGTIDQQGTESWCLWQQLQGHDQKLCRKMNNEGIPLEERIFGEGHYLRPHMIQFYECSNILIEGLTLKDAGFWMIHPVFCKNVTIQEIKFKSNHINNDGIDPESSEYVLIKNIKFDNGDDNIAIKSGRDREAIELARSSCHIVIKDCSFNAYNAMTIGSEISGGVHDIYVENCTFAGNVRSALYIKTNRDRGGETKRIRMRNMEFDSCTEGIRMITNYKSQNTYNRTPSIRDIKISDVFFNRVSSNAIDLLGLEDKHIEDISLENIFFGLADGCHFQHVTNVIMNNVWIDGYRVG